MRKNVVHCKKDKYDVYIGRPSKWGNPFVIGKHGTRSEVVEKYEEWLLGIIDSPNGEKRPSLSDAKRELKGKVLACWCAPYACHGDVLDRLVNDK